VQINGCVVYLFGRRPVLQRARTSPVSLEEPNTTTHGLLGVRRAASGNSTQSSTSSLGSSSGGGESAEPSSGGRRSPPLGPAAKQQLSPTSAAAAAAARRIIEIPSDPDQSANGSSHSRTPPRPIPRPAHLRITASPTGEPDNGGNGSSGGGGGGRSFFGGVGGGGGGVLSCSPSSSSPRSRFLLDAHLPSPRALARGDRRRAKTPLVLFDGAAAGGAGAGAGASPRSASSRSPKGKGGRQGPVTEWEALKAVTKAFRRRRRRHSV
jgi:hypothetical protein